MATTQNKITTISICALEEQRTLIYKAASRLNKTCSDFMLEVACREAENVLLDQRLFLGDENTIDAFHSLLDAPVAGNVALRQLLNQKAPWGN